MAPELMSFQHAPSYAVDVYSLGVVLHHIITGEDQDQRKALRPLRYALQCACLFCGTQRYVYNPQRYVLSSSGLWELNGNGDVPFDISVEVLT